MIWQDIVLGVGSFIFFFALIPSVIGRDKPAFITSLSTGSVLITFAIVYMSLKLWVASAITVLTASLWLALAFQKYSQKKS